MWLVGCVSAPVPAPTAAPAVAPAATPDVRAASAARWAALFRDDEARLRQKYPDKPVAQKRAPVVLPADGGAALAGLEVSGCCYRDETLAGYWVDLRDPTQGPSTARVDGARLTGTPGRKTFDDAWYGAAAAPCAAPGPCKNGLMDWVVPALQVSGRPAYTNIGATGQGLAVWSIMWYDPAGDASYELTVYEMTARRLVPTAEIPASDAAKLRAAQRMAELASGLVAIPL